MLKEYEYQCILTVTINTKDGKLCKQIPVFILPETLGILSLEYAKNVCLSMFNHCDEVHGSVMNSDCRMLSF